VVHSYGANATDLAGNEGHVANKAVLGSTKADTLGGTSAGDIIMGNGGADNITGGGGADVLSGGSGNDVYYVDNAGDQVIEAAGGGSDTVYASVDYTLGAGQEVEFLRTYGSTGLTLTGNELNNYLIGGSGSDTLNELDPMVWTTGSGFLVGAVPFLSHELF
jgi:Ca2+-binding RTX toxin-like protein